MPEHVTVTMQHEGRFTPVVGETTRRLGDLLLSIKALPDRQCFDELHAGAALSILGKCDDPNAAARRATSLVVGYVQSGKTISMTALACAARDNGYKIIVVLAGTTNNLVKQSRERFEEYLRPVAQWWIRDSLKEGSSRKSEVAATWRTYTVQLRGLVQEWRSGKTPPEFAQTAFITVMKNHSHLKRLASLLRDAGVGDMPTLIIDDEADQASLNLAPGEETPSTTYRYIESLRKVAQNHAYVQYTATPQAPLLISIFDALSPDSVTLLGVGAAYTGGETFFRPACVESPYIERLPTDEIEYMGGGGGLEPPATLLHALRLFLLGVAVGYVSGDALNPKKHRSMLVHPSRLKDDHNTFYSWVDAAKGRYVSQLSAAPGSADWREVEEEFLPEYESLAATHANLPSLAALLDYLRWAAARVDVAVVNSDNASEVKWESGYAHILVGGDKLNRGYTVEGLTVTYMPRGIGEGTVDTIQQRARFFGYKADYLGLCRVFLDAQALRAYRAYVAHETTMREHLRQFENRRLNQWKRILYLEPGLQLTRRSVIVDPLFGFHVGRKEWFKMQSPHASHSAIDKNTTTVAAFRAKHVFQPYAKDNRKSPKHRHQVCCVPLRCVLEELMVDFRSVDATDNAGLFPITCVLAEIAQTNPDTTCTVVLMDNLTSRLRTARGEDHGASRVNVHAGEGSTEDGYVGDAAIHEDEQLTIQIHRLNVRTSAAEENLIVDVHALAIWFPPSLRSQYTIVEPTNVAS